MRPWSTTLALALLLATATPAPADAALALRTAVVAAGGMNAKDAPPPGAPASKGDRASDDAPAPPPPPAAQPAAPLKAAPPAPVTRPAPAKPKPAGPAVATVDGVGIPKSEYDRMLAMVKRRYKSRFGIDFGSENGKQMEAEITKGLLDHLVEKQLVLNEGARRHLSVTPTQVTDKIDELKKEAGDEAEFKGALESNGMTMADLQAEVADGLLVRSVADAITSDVTVPDAEVKAYYDAHAAEFDKPEEVRVRHILVKDRATAEKLLAQLQGGADFEALAKASSEDPGSKEDGGDLGFFGKGRMVPAFEEAAFKLKPGELSGLVETQFGFHILKGIERHEARHVPFEEARAELATKLAETRKEAALSSWLNGRKKAAKVTYAPGYGPKAAQKAAVPKKPAAKPKVTKPAKPKGK